jgi:hypothetical protein
MKFQIMRKKLVTFCTLALSLNSFLASAQARLVINGAYMNLSNNATLVIDNPNANAITRNSGHIISEGEYNAVKWNIGTNTGNYVVPFGYSNTDYLPTSFSPSGAVGSGSFLLSTYYGGNATNSSYLPFGISNYNYLGIDHSTKGIDRFWQVNAMSYTTKPAINNLQLSYRDVEHSLAPNTIDESSLMAKRWNPDVSLWDDFSPFSAINTFSNTVTIPSLIPTQQHAWWTLMSVSASLPVESLNFTGHNTEKGNLLFWSTISEINNDYFEVQRSIDAITFATIQTVKSKAYLGNSMTRIEYSTKDANPMQTTNYYRLKQFDQDGNFKYSEVLTLNRNSRIDEVYVYPNPSQGNFSIKVPDSAIDRMYLLVQDIKGEIIYRQFITQPITPIQLNRTAGLYILIVSDSKNSFTRKIVIE